MKYTYKIIFLACTMGTMLSTHTTEADFSAIHRDYPICYTLAETPKPDFSIELKPSGRMLATSGQILSTSFRVIYKTLQKGEDGSPVSELTLGTISLRTRDRGVTSEFKVFSIATLDLDPAKGPEVLDLLKNPQIMSAIISKGSWKSSADDVTIHLPQELEREKKDKKQESEQTEMLQVLLDCSQDLSNKKITFRSLRSTKQGEATVAAEQSLTKFVRLNPRQASHEDRTLWNIPNAIILQDGTVCKVDDTWTRMCRYDIEVAKYLTASTCFAGLAYASRSYSSLSNGCIGFGGASMLLALSFYTKRWNAEQYLNNHYHGNTDPNDITPHDKDAFKKNVYMSGDDYSIMCNAARYDHWLRIGTIRPEALSIISPILLKMGAQQNNLDPYKDARRIYPYIAEKAMAKIIARNGQPAGVPTLLVTRRSS